MCRRILFSLRQISIYICFSLNVLVIIMIECIFCKTSSNIVKSGFRYNQSGKKQKYLCNGCNRLFVPNDGFWKMKTSPEVIAEAISCKKRGMSYNEVSKHFKEYKKGNFSDVTVINWVKKYGKVLSEFHLKQKPTLSGKINLDEFIFKIKKKRISLGCKR